ncbi:MAG: GGDEF domain-containing protein [Sedimenticola sp.]|nr:GGDEF domain-containing protein [Sedimenticola sp.]
MRTFNALLISVILSILIGGVLFVTVFPQGQWVHYPLHAFVEGLGTFIALLIAVLIFMLRIYDRLPVRYVWIVSALMGMGVLDGFHAISQDTQSFIWLHSLAMLIGGFIFSCIWLPDAIAQRGYERQLPIIVFVLAVLAGATSLVFSSSLPLMSHGSEFSPLARTINLTAGGFFFVASAYFLLQYQQTRIRDNSIFASHCLLFGFSGMLFEFSTPWDGVWWCWHILRFAAYALVLYYFFMLSHAEERQLQMLNIELEDQVVQRTLQLSNELKERERIEKELKHLATHDPLTGLYNRNELERRITDDLERANRYVHPLSIFMVDIDHFKEINDRYGHGGGDRVLRSMAFELESSLRKTDYVARFGGEEFLVVLPETSHSWAVELGERLLHRIANHEARLGDENVALTISIGVASYPDIATTWSDLLDAADTAMYQAKHDGRNCLRSAQKAIC